MASGSILQHLGPILLKCSLGHRSWYWVAGEWNPFLLLWAHSVNNTYCLTIDSLWDARQILFYTLGLDFPICKGYFVAVVVYSLSRIWLFCDPMDCRLSSSSVHEISQTRILEWVPISFSRGSSWPKDQTYVSYVSCIGRWVLYHLSLREALFSYRFDFFKQFINGIIQ